MNKFISKILFNKKILLANFLILCIVGNLSSRNNWNRSYTNITYDPGVKSVTIDFRFFDYHFGPFDENGYLSWCDFQYSADGEKYTHLMRAETGDQKMDSWSWLWLKSKAPGAQIQLLNCYNMPKGTLWPDDFSVKLDVYNFIKTDYCYGIIPIYTNLAHFSVKWLLNTPDKDFINAKYIRLKGFWKVNGVYHGDDINYVVYEIPGKVALKSINMENSHSLLNSESNTDPEINAKVFSDADAIIIKGAELCKNINVYNTSGVEIKSIVTNSDVIKVKLPKNHVYIVNIGQTRYKVVL